jgi:hypothetical protein
VPPGHEVVVIAKEPEPPDDVVTVTFAEAVVEPEAFVAVRVYVVVAVGLTVVEPLAEVDVNVPGVIAMLVAPFVAQVNVLLTPEFMLVGLAVNEVTVGADAVPEPPVPVPVPECETVPQLVNATHANRMDITARKAMAEPLRRREKSPLWEKELAQRKQIPPWGRRLA